LGGRRLGWEEMGNQVVGDGDITYRSNEGAISNEWSRVQWEIEGVGHHFIEGVPHARLLTLVYQVTAEADKTNVSTRHGDGEAHISITSWVRKADTHSLQEPVEEMR